MRLSLSTNWCNRRLATGEEIADKALELGFDELELGFHTPADQVPGFRSRLDRMPVGSVHAYCPVPISAPCGYPELYTLASFDEDARALARFHVKRNAEFAAEMGADTVVLHAGRVSFAGFLVGRNFTSGTLRAALQKAQGDVKAKRYARLLAKAKRRRRERGARLLDVFKRELEALFPDLERLGVVLALENLPYLEGFPDEAEMAEIAAAYPDAPVKAWFDTGHHRVRESHGWLAAPAEPKAEGEEPSAVAPPPRGMHLNDVVDFNDDHLAPGFGKVDFAALADMARASRHVVFEPNGGVSEEDLAKGVSLIRLLWPDKA